MTIRTNVFSMLAAGIVAATAAYACSSSSNNTTKPPLNDAGGDVTSSSSSGSSSGSASSSGSGSSSGGTAFNCNPALDSGTLPLCSSLPGHVMYIESADTQETVLDIVGRELRDSANITITFELTGSCTVVPNVYDSTPLPANTQMLYIPSTDECPNWQNGDPELTCLTSATDTTPVDLGISALFPSSCPNGTPPAGFKQFIGPIQAYTFVVPSAEFQNGQTSISAEEAYYAFGDGLNNPVLWNGNPEWNVPTQFYLRPATKSTLVSTALNIGLTPAQMTLAGADGGTADGRQLLGSSTDVLTGVTAATSNQAIGILGSEVYDSSSGRGTTINVLAFAGFGQTTRYYPDSTTTSFDKENVRNGNYTLWSPAVIVSSVNSSGVSADPYVSYFTNVILGTPNATPPGGFVDGGVPIDGLGATVAAGLTPDCAMQVQRSADGAPLTPYTPAAPCTCYFLSKVPSPAPLPASCVACSSSSPCATGTCFNGYCETTPPPSVTPTAVTKTGVVYPGDGGLEPLNP